MLRWNLSVERDGDEVQIHYGFTPSLGFLVSVARAGRLQVTYHSIVTDHTGLSGLLDVLGDFGVFEGEQLREALCAVLLAGSEDDIDDTDVRQLVRIIQDLKQVSVP